MNELLAEILMGRAGTTEQGALTVNPRLLAQALKRQGYTAIPDLGALSMADSAIPQRQVMMTNPNTSWGLPAAQIPNAYLGPIDPPNTVGVPNDPLMWLRGL